jgi:hypothetical protein
LPPLGDPAGAPSDRPSRAAHPDDRRGVADPEPFRRAPRRHPRQSRLNRPIAQILALSPSHQSLRRRGNAIRAPITRIVRCAPRTNHFDSKIDECALECLDLIGWRSAADLLPIVIGPWCGVRRVRVDAVDNPSATIAALKTAISGGAALADLGRSLVMTPISLWTPSRRRVRSSTMLSKKSAPLPIADSQDKNGGPA